MRLLSIPSSSIELPTGAEFSSGHRSLPHPPPRPWLLARPAGPLHMAQGREQRWPSCSPALVLGPVRGRAAGLPREAFSQPESHGQSFALWTRDRRMQNTNAHRGSWEPVPAEAAMPTGSLLSPSCGSASSEGDARFQCVGDRTPRCFL